MSTSFAIPTNEYKIDETQYVETNNTGTMQSIWCNYLVPTLNNTSKKRLEENIEKLQYSIIIDIAHVDSIFGYDDNSENNIDFKKAIDDIYGENGTIMTF